METCTLLNFFRCHALASLGKVSIPPMTRGSVLESQTCNPPRLGHRQAQRMAEILGFFGAKVAGDDDAEEEDAGGTAGAFVFLKKKCETDHPGNGNIPELPMSGVEGVRVYVVGPPKDGEAMRKTNPFKGEGYGLSGPLSGSPTLFLPDSIRRMRPRNLLPKPCGVPWRSNPRGGAGRRG